MTDYKPSSCRINKDAIFANRKLRPVQIWTGHEVEGSLSERYQYNPETGEIRRRVQNYYKGQLVLRSDDRLEDSCEVVWCVSKQGDLYKMIAGQRWLAHHLAYYLFFGRKPSTIKFRDGDKTNLRLSNLDCADYRKKLYRARVSVKNKIIWLGRYLTEKERDETVDRFRFALSLGVDPETAKKMLNQG